MSGSPFSGRTIQVVRDLSVDEQLYLYEQTRLLKEALIAGDGEAVKRFRLARPDLGVYLFFLEESTRTKESFRNAAKFHDVKLNDFSAAGSSFVKKESITDTVKMLVGYSLESVFVVRSKLEGTCRWLEDAIGTYAQKAGLPPVAFINGGDGRHEHPTQEFLDEFSFLEHLSWDRSHIHLALVGDLFHGRTVHSKVDGLQVFGEVEVDLVAPAEIGMPDHYVEQMKERGFAVRAFESIEEYLADQKVAPLWYFTRLQLERMGEQLLDKADRLRQSVTFRRDFLGRLSGGTRFFHPLPRHQVTPTIPSFLDETPLNAWDGQSMNGYYTRMIELALVAGHLGDDFSGRVRDLPDYPDDFVHEVSARTKRKPDYKIGIKPVDNGIVIDHIGRGSSPAAIWDQIDKVRRILGLNRISSHGVFTSNRGAGYKGIISLPDLLALAEHEVKMLGASAPGCTLNIVQEGNVVRKYRMGMPPRVYNLPGISCKNEDCISHPSHHEPINAEFLRAGENRYVCKYCERPHAFGEIW
ncbi:MAG: aspartate carbamoyltransferase [Spirochaetota bacterium]